MKASLLTTRAAAMFALSFAAGGANAAGKWDGADDLPTSPLACEAGGAATPEAAKPFDGGKAAGAADKSGKEITIVDVPKLIGIGYFNATSKGMQDAAKELGNVKVTTDGPTEAKIDEQIKFIDNYITRGVDGVMFAANDPVAIAPVLKKALSKGIHVVGYDANSQPDAREWFVNQAEFNGIGKSMIDSMVKEIGEDGSFAIVGLATPNAMRPYVNADCVKSVVLWNPVDLGYAATYVMRAVADGKLKPGSTSVDAGEIGKLNVVNGSEILLGAPFIFNKDNVTKFDF